MKVQTVNFFAKHKLSMEILLGFIHPINKQPNEYDLALIVHVFPNRKSAKPIQNYSHNALFMYLFICLFISLFI